MKKTIKTLILAATVLTALFCLATVSSAANIIRTAACGSHVSYTLYDDGSLIISGTGEMSDYDEVYNKSPWYRENVSSVKISNGVTSIGETAFKGCTELTSVEIPDSVTSIGSFAFLYCAGLTNIELPDSLTSIGNQAFGDCTGLTSIEIPDGVISIEGSTFEGCTGLTSIEIPKSVISIGNFAFDECDNVKYIFYEGSEKDWNNVYLGSYNNCFRLNTTYFHYNCTGHTGGGADCTKTDVCIVCGCEIPPELSHDFSTEWTIDREATYTEAGEKSHHCTRCSERSDITVIPKLQPKITFPDVKTSDWYYEAVAYATDNSIINGMDGKFAPNVAMTRGMLVTVLWRMENSPEPTGASRFTDLKQDWYKKAVIWAAENGIVDGTSVTTFSPENPITREQMAKMFMSYAQYKKYDTTKTTIITFFPDASKVSKWAQSSMCWAVAEGLIGGSDERLLPQGQATRAQVATIIMRFCKKYN